MLLTGVGGIAVAPEAHAVEPVRPRQWYLNNWNIEEAWKISQGEGITVALIDTGVDANHPDLVGQIVGEPYGTGDGFNHGTAMASEIAGTGRGLNGQGAYGVAPKAKIVSYKVHSYDDLRSPLYAQALRDAADSAAQIISISGGGGREPGLSAAIAYAQSRGKLVVAASGNLSAQQFVPTYPAADPGVLGVGGYDQTGKVWEGSVTGNWVSLAGPAPDIVSACAGATGYCNGKGTSNATALTSGVAALVWSAHPNYTANQVIKVLIDSANKPGGPLPNDSLGWGNVSPRNALNWTGDPGPPDVNPLVGKRGDLPAASPTPIPTASAQAQPVPSPSVSTAPDAVASDSSGGGGSNTGVLVGAIGGGAVLLLVVVGLFIRSRASHR